MIRKLRKQLRKNRGFTLVELMIVVAIVGILAALAIYGVRKYMTNAKTAEARNGVGQMGKDAVTAYFKEGMAASVMALGSSTGLMNKICPNIAAMVPTALTSVAAKKYQSSPNEWSGGWDCLHFSMNDPQYYQYGYTATTVLDTPGTAKFTAKAVGDLDGDAAPSSFTLEGAVVGGSGAPVTCVLAPNLAESASDE